MNHLNIPAIAIIIFISFQACKPSSDIRKAGSEYSLVWSDEFNGDTIDTKTWNYNIGGSGWGNNEQEYYTDHNASIENGNLVITAKPENVGSNGYTSARMTTQGKREFRYGKIEARIKFSTGMGIWPAFWMLGSNIDRVGWPDCGEIDIMEHINTDSIFYGTLHWGNGGKVSSGNNIKGGPEDFHTYSILWDADSINWYFDDIKYHQVIIKDNQLNTEEFHNPFFILLNMAIGGDWPGQTVDPAKLPAKMQVDFVRVYQKS